MTEATGAELTSDACRAARALLRWKLADLSEATGLSIETLTQFEHGRAMRKSNRDKIQKAFAAAGVVITNGTGTGAKLLKDRPPQPKLSKAAKPKAKAKRKD